MNRRIAPIVALVVAQICGLAGCNGSGRVTAPTPISSSVSPAGNWSGTIADPVSGEGTVNLSLSELPPNLTGTWSAAFKNGDSFSGPATASQFEPPNYGIMLYVNPPPQCTSPGGQAALGYTLVNVSVTSTTLTAGAMRINCSGFSFGSISLTRQ